MEAFSDGVIAIIITIMVLELHVPHENGIAGLWSVAPRIGIYLLSFVMIGIFWLNHHEMVRRTESVSYSILVANLLWLFSLSLIPFFADYVGENHFDAFSAALYAAAMMCAGATFGLLRLTLLKQQRRSMAVASRDRAEAWKHAASVLLYCAAIPAAYVRPWLSLALNVAVTLIWRVPWLGTRHLLPDTHTAKSR